MSEITTASATTQQKRQKTMEGGTAHEGLLVLTPDGRGRVIRILNPDTVMIDLEDQMRQHPISKQLVPVQIKCDLSECVALEPLNPRPEEPETPESEPGPETPADEHGRPQQPPPSTPEAHPAA